MLRGVDESQTRSDRICNQFSLRRWTLFTDGPLARVMGSECLILPAGGGAARTLAAVGGRTAGDGQFWARVRTLLPAVSSAVRLPWEGGGI